MIHRVMKTEKFDGTKYFFLLLSAIVFLGYYVFCTTFPVQSHRQDVDMKQMVRNFVKYSAFASYVDVDATHTNTSVVVRDFSQQYNEMLVELMAFKPFDLVIQYDVSPNYIKYEYVCKNTSDCFAIHHPLPTYKTMKILVQLTPDTFNVHGRYYLK